MNDTFKSKFTLKFKNAQIERDYKENGQKKLKSCNIIFCSTLLAFSLLNDLVYLFYTPKEEQKNIWKYFLIANYILTGIHSVILIMSIIQKNSIIQKVISYLVFAITILTFFNLRTYVSLLRNLDYSIFTLLFFLENLIRMTCFFTDCIDFIEGFYLYITLDIVNYAVYGPIFPLYLHMRFGILFVINSIMSFLAYNYVSEKRKSFYFDYNSRKNLKWYSSVIENINSGFISIENSRIQNVNKSFISLLMKDETRDILFSAQILNDSEGSAVLKKKSLIHDISEDNIALILEKLFEGIIFKDNNIKLETKTNYESATIFVETKNEEENFIFLGSKSITLRENNTQEYYEIFGRCYISEGEEKTYEFIFNDVTKIKLKEEINADHKYKKIFLSKVAHEFKNPLICIIELIDQILDKVAKFDPENDLDRTVSNSNKKEFILDVNEILNSVKHMSNYLLILVKDMDFFSLTFSAKRSQLKLDKEMVKLKEIITFCYNITEALIKKYLKDQSVKFRSECNNLPETIYTDETRLKQLLINLLSNSVKYTDFGSITLKVDGLQDKLRFEVRDTGKGLSESQQSRLVSDSHERGEISQNGSALGMKVVKDILDLFDTKLEYKGCENQGSMFSFVIDSRRPSNYIKIPENMCENEKNQIIIENYSENSISSPQTLKKDFVFTKIDMNDCNLRKTSLPSNHTSADALSFQINNNAHCIMVVDDEMITRKSTVRLLNNYFDSFYYTNYVIIEAADGIECLYMFYDCLKKGVNLSMIISDETMNYMNGCICAKVLNELISMKKLRAVPFFILTAYEGFESEARSGIIKAYSKPLSKIIIEDIFHKIGIKID